VSGNGNRPGSSTDNAVFEDEDEDEDEDDAHSDTPTLPNMQFSAPLRLQWHGEVLGTKTAAGGGSSTSVQLTRRC